MKYRSDLAQRDGEVQQVLQHLRVLESQTTAQIVVVNATKASLALMLYNLVEAEATQLFQFLIDHLKRKKVQFSQATYALQRFAYRKGHKRGIDNLFPKDSEHDFLVNNFNVEDLFTGNIDARLLRDHFDDIGLTLSKRGEDALLTVKEARNRLAHGDVSFADWGKSYSTSDIDDWRQRIVSFFKSLATDLVRFLKTQSYKRVSRPHSMRSTPKASGT